MSEITIKLPNPITDIEFARIQDDLWEYFGIIPKSNIDFKNNKKKIRSGL